MSDYFDSMIQYSAVLVLRCTMDDDIVAVYPFNADKNAEPFFRNLIDKATPARIYELCNERRAELGMSTLTSPVCIDMILCDTGNPVCNINLYTYDEWK